MAKSRDVSLTGTAKICNYCAVGKVWQKNVLRATVKRAFVPGERMFIDISSPRVVGIGGQNTGYFVLMMHQTVDLVSSCHGKTCWHSN